MSTTQFTFADRYRAAGLSPTSEIIRARQVPFEKLRSSLDVPEILTLTRLYFGLPPLESSDWFRDAFAETDQSFSLIDNKREGALLAYCLLAAALEDGQVVAGLAPLTTSVGGRRTPLIFPEFIVEAEETLARQSVNTRSCEFDPSTITMPKAAGSPVLAEGDWSAVSEGLKTVNKNSYATVESLAKQLKSVIDSFGEELKHLREEADMLWWLVGGWSRTFNRPFSAYGPGLVAVLAGLDMAKLVLTDLGPISVPAMLQKQLLAAVKRAPSKVTLQDTVDGIDASEISKLQIDSAVLKLPDLCPVLAAFFKAHEIGPSPSWHSAYRKLTGMDEKADFTLLDLSVQTFREVLLLKHADAE